MFRPSAITGAGFACPIRFRGHELVELGRGKWAEWPVKPGRYLLANKDHSVEINVASGEKRYVKCSMQVKTWTFSAHLELTDDYHWKEHSSEYTKKQISNPPSE